MSASTKSFKKQQRHTALADVDEFVDVLAQFLKIPDQVWPSPRFYDEISLSPPSLLGNQLFF